MVDSKSSSYKSLMVTSSVLLLVFVVVGAIWELAKKLKTRRMVLIEGKSVKEVGPEVCKILPVMLDYDSVGAVVVGNSRSRC